MTCYHECGKLNAINHVPVIRIFMGGIPTIPKGQLFMARVAHIIIVIYFCNYMVTRSIEHGLNIQVVGPPATIAFSWRT